MSLRSDLSTVREGDMVLMAHGGTAVGAQIEGVGLLFITAAGCQWDRQTGELKEGTPPIPNMPWRYGAAPARLVLPAVYEREQLIAEIGRSLSALQTQVLEPGSADDLDMRLDRLTVRELKQASTVGNLLCDLLGVRP